MPNIHPLIVHFPVALAFAVVIFDLIGIFSRRPSFISAATKLSVFAALGGAAAVITGLIAEESVRHSDAAHELLETHEALGFAFLGVMVIMAIFRLAVGKRLEERGVWIAVLLGLTAAAVVGTGAYIGGELVYRYHVGIGGAGVEEAGERAPGSAVPDSAGHDDDGHEGRGN